MVKSSVLPPVGTSSQPAPWFAATAATTVNASPNCAFGAVNAKRPSAPVLAYSGARDRCQGEPLRDLMYTVAPSTGCPSGASTRPAYETVSGAASPRGRSRAPGGTSEVPHGTRYRLGGSVVGTSGCSD